MEDGPARRTRSSTTTEKIKGVDILNSNISVSDSEVFKTPQSSPSRNKRLLKKKNRTPSGQYLANSVEDIRNFFLQRSEKSPYNSTVKENQWTVTESEILTHISLGTKAQSTEIIHLGSEPYKVQSPPQHQSVCQLPSQTTVQTDNILSSHITQRKEKERCEMAYLNVKFSIADRCRSLQSIKDQRDLERLYKEGRQQKVQQQQNTASVVETVSELSKSLQQGESVLDENQVMDVKIIYEMFNEIRKDIAKHGLVEGEQRMIDLQERQDVTTDKMISLESKLLECQTKTELLMGAVQQLSNKAEVVDERLEKLEWNNMKNSMILTGFLGSKKKASCMAELEAFFTLRWEYK